MNFRLILYIIIIVAFKNDIISQNEPLSDIEREKIITNQLYPKGKKRIETLKDNEKDADRLMNETDDYYKQLSSYRLELSKIKKGRKREKLYKKMVKVENKALGNRIKSLDNYHDVAVQKYQIYKIDFQKFMKTGSQLKVDSAKVWERQADIFFEEADVKIKIAYHTINYSDIFDIYTHAYKLEQMGLLYQHKIYSLFLDWHQTNFPKIDKEIKSMQENIPFYFREQKDTIIQRAIKDSIIFEKVMVYDTITIKEKIPELIFRVQIAASKKPLKVDKLKKIYQADDIINTIIEDGWYKYSVGLFESYHEAKKFKINIGVSDAFVVVYKRGKKIEVSEALKSLVND